MSHPLFFQWGVSALYGWGVYGLNLLYHWPRVSGGAKAVCGANIQIESLTGMDILRLNALAPVLVASDQERARLTAMAEAGERFNGITLHSMGNKFTGSAQAGGTYLKGTATCGVTFFEDTDLPQAKAYCDDFAVIVTGSTWGEEILRSKGVTNVATVIQGIDPSLFHPAPRFGGLSNRFTVFSGGKMELRKGQDLVVQAFRIFAARHPEAILITAWSSPWQHGALTLNLKSKIVPIALEADGKLDLPKWLTANGLQPGQFLDLGGVPNHLMGRVLREMDVAVFPNRCEGGTNLVAMECMASGVPTIVSNNTGHKDLVATGAPYILTRQAPVTVPDLGTEGWGESDVDEIVDKLEQAFTNREDARRRGAAGAAAMAALSWENQVAQLYRTLSATCP